MPELRQLRAFVAVAEELNFTRAAERLFLAQQAVSRQVAQLESELGVPLFDRTTHAVTLTAGGAALLDRGREALAAADAAFEHARWVGSGLGGTARIGATPAVGPQVRAQAVATLRRLAPELMIDVREVRPGDVRSALRDGSLEAVLTRVSPGMADLESASLPPTPAALLVPRGHRLEAAGPIELSALDGERLLTWNETGTPYTDMLLRRLAAGGARVEPMQALVLGGSDPPDLAARDVVALVPEGWPAGEHAVEVALAEPLELPLLLLWPAGRATATVDRLRRGLTPAPP